MKDQNSDKFDLNKQLEKIRSRKFEQSLSCFEPDPSEQVQVQIRADKSVTRAKFKTDPLNPGHYKAHPSTIKALRSDIFVTGNNSSDEMFLELEKIIKCESCNYCIDIQFWKFCPQCESSYKVE